MKWYSNKNLLKTDAKYMICYGERSSGKTYAWLEYIVKRYFEFGEQGAVIRRWLEDLRGNRGATYFDNLVYNGKGENIIKKLSKGKFDRVVYTSSRWYMAYYDEQLQKVVPEDEPFCYAFTLSQQEHDKSSSYPKVKTILFDEFMTRKGYIPDEFVVFMNVVSTIVRSRSDVKIAMAANTISMYCPYFKEMGLTHVRQQKQGTIDIYNYGDSGLKVAVEYTEQPVEGKPSDVYFAFDNPKIQMITKGCYELDIYPHISIDYDKSDIVFTYFVIFEEHTLQCEIIIKDNILFTYVHLKTTPIKDMDDDVIYELTANEKHNYYINLLYPIDELSKKITYFYKANKVFYQSNEVGEIMNNYLIQCRNSIVR